ncbi:hypothetical protein A0H81_13823 [Grifola frondosa]|uniref:Uncharacterized protein n=1 Tax=Grifola frondosa TaxID=5627 RepID=A0A1C7LQ98_GRIFR|nr:hypothetical protein A0H81_13823 [Grifola frondosa]
MRLNGGTSVAESQFAQLVDGLEDSISGSASSSEGESDESDAVDTLLHKTRRLARSPSLVMLTCRALLASVMRDNGLLGHVGVIVVPRMLSLKGTSNGHIGSK